VAPVGDAGDQLASPNHASGSGAVDQSGEGAGVDQVRETGDAAEKRSPGSDGLMLVMLEKRRQLWQFMPMLSSQIASRV
jgi:hypothetical protein